MKREDLIELDIHAMSFGPAAVGRYTPPGESRAMVVFVEGAAPGERVRVKLTGHHKNYWEAQLVEVLVPSPDRVTPPCGVFGRCGGCQWQHLSYRAQIDAKTKVLLHQISRATRIPEDELRARLVTHEAPSPFGYRSRLQVRGDAKGLGFFAPSSHTIVHTDRCEVAHPDIQKAWREFGGSRRLGSLAEKTGQFKVEWTRTESGQVTESLNRKHGALGFTQVNPEQNKVLVGVVSEFAGKGHALLDLFGGDGNLTNGLVDRFEHIVSVDAFGEGMDPVEGNAPPPAGRVFVKEKVEEFLRDQRWRDWGMTGRFDCVVADPPREGLKGAVEMIARIGAKRIVLVSCDPTTLGRDLATFVASGYRVGRVHLIDMFPQTYHIESVVELTPNALDTTGGPPYS